MSVKKDESGRRWVEMEVEVPGSPQEVWEAMATGPGISAWFVPTDVEEKVGGKIEFHMGPGMESIGEVTEWQPPHRFGYVERDWMPGAPEVATEIVVETRSGDTCVVRMVHSFFTTEDDWDDQLESFEQGWPGFFRVLHLRMTHFRGLPSARVQAMGSSPDPEPETWHRLLGLLGLEGAEEGTPWQSSKELPEGAGSVRRVSEGPTGHEALILLERPVPGVFTAGSFTWGKSVYVGIGIYFYGDEAASAAEHQDPRWQAWTQEHFPPPEQPPEEDPAS